MKAVTEVVRLPYRGVVRALVAGGVLAGSLALIGMGGGSGAGAAPKIPAAVKKSPTGVNTTSACKGKPVRGGSLTYARSEGPVTLNPFYPTNGNGDIFIDTLLYQGVVRPTQEGKTQNVEPAVATSWTVSKSGTVYTFHLRPGIKFSNGDPVTATDVKFSLDYFASSKDEGQVLSAGFKDVVIVNPSTVQMNLTEPTPGIIYDLSIWDAMIVPENLVKKEGTAFWSHPVGTGPYELTSWVRGSSITLKRNPYYWQKGLPYLTKITFKYATTGNSRLLDLEDKQAQVITDVTFSDIATVRANPELTLQLAKVPYWVGLWLNEEKAPFRTLDVRQALEYAIDKPLINKKVFSGVGTLPNSILPQLKGDASDSEIHPYSFDVKKAKALMAKSHYPHGFSTTLMYPSGLAEYTDLDLILQSEWAKLGIKIKLLATTEAIETKDYTGGDYTMTYPYVEYTSDVTVPDEYAEFVAVPDSDHAFYSWWTDPTIAKMVETYIHTPKPTRVTLWHKIQDAMLVQTPDINVMDLPFVNAHLKNVCGTYLNPLGADSLQYTWIAK